MNNETKINIENLVNFYLFNSLKNPVSSASGSTYLYPATNKSSSEYEDMNDSEHLILLKRSIQLEEKLKYIESRQFTTESVTTDWMMGLENRIKTIEKDSHNLELEKKFLRLNVDILSEIGELQDNWNNYGAQKFNQELIFKCLRIINSTNLKFQPEIFPTANQSIQFEYEPDDQHYLEVEIFNDHIKIYGRVNAEIRQSDNLTVEEVIDEINQFQSEYGY